MRGELSAWILFKQQIRVFVFVKIMHFFSCLLTHVYINCLILWVSDLCECSAKCSLVDFLLFSHIFWTSCFNWIVNLHILFRNTQQLIEFQICISIPVFHLNDKMEMLCNDEKTTEKPVNSRWRCRNRSHWNICESEINRISAIGINKF